MRNVIIDENVLRNHRNAETDSVSYLFESLIFLYDFLGKQPEYSQEFDIHSELLEGALDHFDSSTEDLTAEDISVLLENLRNVYESKFNEPIPVSKEDSEIVKSAFSGEENDPIVSERVAFFAIVRDSQTLKNLSGSREKFWSVVFYFYGKLGSYVYWLKDQNDSFVFQSKLKRALAPSLNPEDVYFEFSIAHDMKRQNVILKFIPEKEIKTPDFEIYFNNQILGYLECTLRRQKNRQVIELVREALTTKAGQMLNATSIIKCLAINMPYDLKVNNLDAKIFKKNGVSLIYLTDDHGIPYDQAKNETLDIGEALKEQKIFSHLLVTSNHFLKFLPDGIGWAPKRRLFQKRNEIIFPGNWPEGIMVV